MRAQHVGSVGRCWQFGAASLLALALVAVGCGDDEGGDPDAGSSDSGADAQTDTGPDTGAAPTCSVGVACERNADCFGGFCEAEQPASIPVMGLPNGNSLDAPLFPGGACSPTPFAPADALSSCDLSEVPGQQGCGSCGVCVPEVLSTGVFAVCRESCEPEAIASGCSRPGYTCEFGFRGCVEGCRSDEECRLRSVDTNNDGRLDTVRFDPTSTATCDSRTFRCTHTGTANASAGDPCEDDEDCEADGRCILPEQALSGFSFPGGYCSKRGCDIPGLNCAGLDSICVAVRGNSAGSLSLEHCMLACERGAEADPLILGTDGHGEGCRTGYRCAWDGINGVGSGDNGICVGGNYNAVTVNNVGAECARNDECYSPYGQGQCLRLSVGPVSSPSGHCTIIDCAAPGTPDDICGASGECIGLSGDASFCVRTCESAAECAAGEACADDDGIPSTGTICYPACYGNEECRSGETCVPASSQSTAGVCTPA